MKENWRAWHSSLDMSGQLVGSSLRSVGEELGIRKVTSSFLVLCLFFGQEACKGDDFSVDFLLACTGGVAVGLAIAVGRHVDEIGAQEGSGKAEDRTRDILGLGGMEAPQVRNKEQVWDSAGLEVANRQEEIHPEKSALCFKKDKLEISNC